MQSVTPPAPFMQDPSEPPLQWKLWIRSFKAYLVAIDGTKFKPERKKGLMYYHLGVEGQNIFDHLPDYEDSDDPNIDEFDAAVAQLDKYFAKSKNLVVHRFKFFTRVQKPCETIDTYVTALKVLASTCEFEEFTSQLIRDQLIVRCNSKKIQERLLSCKNPSLDKAVDIAKGF